jgi:BirA family transcriptional regulator, biotin operon repressor / biotin---[acetyl-CoA-carboxylase] ligase
VTAPVASPLLARRERFDVVGSTNDVVRGWLADGTPEVCLAVADEQSAGRGREGRSWTAPAGAALLLSLGFRPAWLAPEHAWRLAAAIGLAMAEAAESIATLEPGTIRLKWPNDLVLEADGGVRKLAGVLGETDGVGTADPRAVVGIGVNVDWPASEFPPDLATTMTSLREAAGDRPIDRDELLAAFLARLEPGVDALRAGRFEAEAWVGRQVTTGRRVRLLEHGGTAATVRALAPDPGSGALVVEDSSAAGGTRQVWSADVVHVRLEPGV